MLVTSSSSFATALIIGLVIALVLGSLHKKRRLAPEKHGIPLPPGPPPGWFWSSHMPTTHISSTFNDWANHYGPVFTIRQGNQIAIVVTRVDAATEVLEKGGGALVDRPPMIAANEILSGGKRIVLMGNGERFRRYRKTIHTHVQPKAVETYKDMLFEQAKILILDLLNDPKNHQKVAHRFSTSIILRIAYGRSSPKSIDDPAFVGVQQVMEHFNEATRPGAYLVDRFPWLKHVPGYGRRLKEHHDFDLRFYSEQLDRVKRAMSSDDADPSFSRMLLENVREHQFSFDEMAFLAGTLYEAGSGTTSFSISAMVMAAACFPSAQLRVQEELDKVIGMDRLPTWSDWDALPQLHAFISETLRWRPVGPFGVPRRSTKDIIWRGYCIPAGTTVYGNHWSIGRDPVVFPDPETFDPQRWLDQNGQIRSDMNCYTFGFGRRVCPGMHLANRSIFIGLALLLWSFQIVELPEAPIDTTPDTDSVVAHLMPFVVRFVPRMGEARLREMMV